MTITTKFCRATVALLAISTTAYAQPAKRPPPPPTQPVAPEPPPGPDPETAAKLDEQAAALAKTSEQLAAQQQVIDTLVARQAELSTALESARTEQTAAAARLDTERAERLAAEKAATQHASVRSSWPQVTLGGFLQVDAAYRQSSEDELRQSGDPLNADRVLLRRARPKLAAAYGQVGGVIEIDINTVNGGQVRPSAVEATYQAATWLKAGMGIAKIPFGFELEQSDRERLFLERTNAARALFPGEYDLGVKASGAWRYIRYGVAVQNGEPIGERGFTLRDPNVAKDFTARTGLEIQAGDVRLAGGFSFLMGRGFHAGTQATKDQLVWRDINEDGVVNPGEIQVIAGQAATPSESFDRFALGVDTQLAIDLHEGRRLVVYGELSAAGNLDRATVVADPVASGRDVRELGWYVAGVYEPATWSAVGIRYDRYDPDADASELRTGMVIPVDQTLSTLAATAALRGQHGRLILEYAHNKNHLGRTTSGVPTNLGDDAVTLRAEVQL